jgi:hypothetical protein
MTSTVPTREGKAVAEYTAINVSHAARDELRTFAARAGGMAASRVTMTDALRIAIRIATAHLATDGPAVWQAITTESNGETQ